MKERNVAVVGQAWVGRRHAEAWLRCKGARLVGVVDPAPQARHVACEELGIDEDSLAFADYRQLLDRTDADIVSVCVPTGMHEHVVGDILASGRHVLCEKPPAASAAEAARMMAAAGANGVVLGYSLQRRFSDGVQAARAAIDEGRIGEVFYGRAGWVRRMPSAKAYTLWRLDGSEGGGSLGDLGVHMLDSAWYAMGCPRPETVSATISSRLIPALADASGVDMPTKPADDTAAAFLRFEGGKTLLLESSFGLWRASGVECYCELSGTSGAVEINPKALLITGQAAEPLVAPAGAPPVDFSGVVGDMLEAVNEDRPPCVSAEQGLHLMQMIEGMARSATEGREIRIGECQKFYEK